MKQCDVVEFNILDSSINHYKIFKYIKQLLLLYLRH